MTLPLALLPFPPGIVGWKGYRYSVTPHLIAPALPGLVSPEPFLSYSKAQVQKLVLLG